VIAITAAAGISSVVGFAFSAVGQRLLAPLMHDLIEVAEILMVCSIVTLWRWEWEQSVPRGLPLISSCSLPNKSHAEVVGYAQNWGMG